MESPITIITTDQDFENFSAVLRSSGLPADDLRVERDLLIAYHEDGQMVATGALEIYGGYGLLRSLSVKLGTRGKALGTTVTQFLIEEARKRNVTTIYLLTDSARGFFQKKGFVEVDRNDVPVELHVSSEFSHGQRASAVAMKLDL